MSEETEKTLKKTAFLSNLEKENFEKLKELVKVRIIHAAQSEESFHIDYLVSNFSIFDLRLYKFIEESASFSWHGTYHTDLAKGERHTEIEIPHQREAEIQVLRTLSTYTLEKMREYFDKLSGNYGFGWVLGLETSFVAYFKVSELGIKEKFLDNPLELRGRCGFRFPHYDLHLGFLSNSK